MIQAALEQTLNVGRTLGEEKKRKERDNFPAGYKKGSERKRRRMDLVVRLGNRSEGRRDRLVKKSAEIAVLRPRNGQGSGSTGTTTGKITEI